MRSPTPTTRRLNARTRARSRPSLEDVARLVDAELDPEEGHAGIHVSFPPGGELELGVLPIPVELHPFAVLAGTVAPASWVMFGVRVRGTAHHLDDGARERCSTTYLVARDGAEIAVVREADRVTVIDLPAEGTLPDLCRRVLQLATPPPPSSTDALFALAWLDSVFARVAAHPGEPMTRADVAALHPAATDEVEPAAFADAVRAHAARWPWSSLRAAPRVLALPGADLPASVTRWMDDGAYARWALGAFPPPAQLAADLGGLLPTEASRFVVEAIQHLITGQGP